MSNITYKKLPSEFTPKFIKKSLFLQKHVNNSTNGDDYDKINTFETIQKHEKVEPSFECLICFESTMIEVTTLNCNHKFHFNCLSEWDKIRKTKYSHSKSGILECPNCMTDREIINIEYVPVTTKDYKKRAKQAKQANGSIQNHEPQPAFCSLFACCTIL